MEYLQISKLLGAVNLFLCGFMFPCLLLGLVDGNGWKPLLGAITICIVFSLPLLIWGKSSNRELSRRSGFALVALIWLSVSFFGSLPFLFSGYFASFTDSFFEAVSGFTTTGATILYKVSDLPRSLLLWRSIIQWLGGMGVVLLTMVMMPLLGVGAVLLFKAEVPGPSVEKLRPRIRATAKLLWTTYVILTTAAAFCLWIAGMGLFDAICHAFTTLATGGFSTHDSGIMGFHNPAVEMVLIFFMLVAGCNFVLHYRAICGHVNRYWHSEEFRWYLYIYLLIAIGLFLIITSSNLAGTFSDKLRHAFFQTASIMTTTGYHSVDFEAWRMTVPAVFMLLMIAMFIGGMGGSTSGGMKTVRVMTVFKMVRNSLQTIVHPRSITKIRLNGASLPENLMTIMLSFMCLHILIFIIVATFITVLGVDAVTSMSAAAACLNNIGPGFGTVGPLGNYAAIPTAGKWVLALAMMMGRLEIFTILVLIIPGFGRNRLLGS